MNILWITNIKLPPLCNYLGIKTPNSGGWMYSSLQHLMSLSNDIKISVATYYDGNVIKKYEINNILYYLLPSQGSIFNYQKKFELYWKRVNEEFKPDIVHLHGTEFPHGLAFLNACPNVKSVVSIQGLVSVIADNYLKGIAFKDILLSSLSVHDIIRNTPLWKREGFRERGEFEKDIIRKTDNIIGRTTWDKSHVWAINPNVKYYFCNETLRDTFYEYKWEYVNCIPHSIFISQAGYSIKGLHQVLKALPLVLREYPDCKIYVAGPNVVKVKSFIQRLKLSGYGIYLRRIIKKYDLTDHINFLGNLDEKQMCQQYLSSNVFICPSSIENSPNSLGEAQLLGMPVIASYVGGIPDMMKGFEYWMYRFEEIEMLAKKICEVFESGDNINFINDQALQRHNKSVNSMRLFEIYKDILNK